MTQALIASGELVIGNLISVLCYDLSVIVMLLDYWKRNFVMSLLDWQRNIETAAKSTLLQQIPLVPYALSTTLLLGSDKYEDTTERTCS